MNIDALSLYNDLCGLYGETKWWPGDTSDEIIVGAILTQNTTWTNVERSLSMMKEANLLSLEKLASVDRNRLIGLIRSSGFYSQKSSAIIEISARITDQFAEIGFMKNEPVEKLEKFLMSIKGIGQETMDAILCYALEKPVFVVDKYTLRLLHRLGILNVSNVKAVKSYVDSTIGRDYGKLKNFHGLIVNFAKEYCKSKPMCEKCPIVNKCDYGSMK